MHELEPRARQGGCSLQQLEAPSTGKLECAQLRSAGTSGVMSWWPTAKLRVQEHLWERRKPGHAAVVIPHMAYQTAPLHFSHCSDCINIFLNKRGRHCNDNQGDQTKLVWKCMTDFLPSLPFCCATHLTFWSAAKVELSPPFHYFPHQDFCHAKLGLGSVTASSTTGQWGECRESAAQFRAEKSLPCLSGQNRYLIRLLRGRNIIPVKHHCVLVERERKCGPTLH